MKPPFRLACLVVVLVGGAVQAQQPSSCPSWRPCGGDTWTGNRFIPQGRAGADFRPTCARHDACYGAATDVRNASDMGKARFSADGVGIVLYHADPLAPSGWDSSRERFEIRVFTAENARERREKTGVYFTRPGLRHLSSRQRRPLLRVSGRFTPGVKRFAQPQAGERRMS